MITLRRPAFHLAACALLVACVGGSSAPADQLINIGSHRLQVHREGKRAPAVVIDAGITDQLDKLKPLQQRLAQVTQVITYNRAGYGQSEPGPLPRDGAREAEELKILLEKASVPGPYVLVGHSLGTLNVMLFAARYPKEVAALILLDPPPLSFISGQDYQELRDLAEGMTAQWQALADSAAKSSDPRDQAQAAFFRMIASEHREMFGATAQAVAEISTFGEIPLLVMAAGKPNPAFGPIAEEYQKYWIEQSRALCSKSARSKFLLAEKSSHYLYLEATELVEKSILGLVEEVRGK